MNDISSSKEELIGFGLGLLLPQVSLTVSKKLFSPVMAKKGAGFGVPILLEGAGAFMLKDPKMKKMSIEALKASVGVAYGRVVMPYIEKIVDKNVLSNVESDADASQTLDELAKIERDIAALQGTSSDMETTQSAGGVSALAYGE